MRANCASICARRSALAAMLIYRPTNSMPRRSARPALGPDPLKAVVVAFNADVARDPLKPEGLYRADRQWVEHQARCVLLVGAAGRLQCRRLIKGRPAHSIDIVVRLDHGEAAIGT